MQNTKITFFFSRYFSSSNYNTGGSIQAKWDIEGEIKCTVYDDLDVDLILPDGFDSTKTFKAMTHGFMDTVNDGKIAFVDAWMESNNFNVNGILVDWSELAFVAIVDWDSIIYDAAARNAIDVGEYLGHCLGALSSQAGIQGGNFHLAGHSLGAHLMGKAGRTFREVTGQFIDRITGCDPAGPRFVDGPLLPAIPELHNNRINPESAAFVDIIHTDASLEPAAVWIIPRLGDLHPLGHMDFYPDGGSAQNGCGFLGPDGLPGGVCSHKRSYLYLLHSFLEPDLFPSKECADVEACSEGQVISEDVVSFMGEKAQVFDRFCILALYFLL